MDEAEVTRQLGLDKIVGRRWSVHPTVATKNTATNGLVEALNWYVLPVPRESASSRFASLSCVP